MGRRLNPNGSPSHTRAQARGPKRGAAPPVDWAAWGVGSDDWKAVADYLRDYPRVAAVLPAVCEQVRSEFGAVAELLLGLYRDPEIDDRYLALRVRLPRYAADVMDRIERVSRSFEDRISPDAGYLLITTDFLRPARGKNAV